MADLLLFPVAPDNFAVKSLGLVEKSAKEFIMAVDYLFESRDPYTKHHSHRVARYTLALAAEIGLNEYQTQRTALAGHLHDLGKLSMPDSILFKPGKLTEQEWVTMRSHPEMGARLLSASRFYRDCIRDVLHHHEAWNGSGYPHGLVREDIPLGARIIAVTDAFDAMTTDRSYRKALPIEEAINRLQAGRNIQWQASLVDAFVGLIPLFFNEMAEAV